MGQTTSSVCDTLKNSAATFDSDGNSLLQKISGKLFITDDKHVEVTIQIIQSNFGKYIIILDNEKKVLEYSKSHNENRNNVEFVSKDKYRDEHMWNYYTNKNKKICPIHIFRELEYDNIELKYLNYNSETKKYFLDPKIVNYKLNIIFDDIINPENLKD